MGRVSDIIFWVTSLKSSIYLANWHIYFWAHLCVCTVGSYASLSVCLWLDQIRLDRNSDLTKSHWTKSHWLNQTAKCHYLTLSQWTKSHLLSVPWSVHCRPTIAYLLNRYRLLPDYIGPMHCKANAAYTSCTLPVQCKYTPVQSGLQQRQVGSLQRQVVFFWPRSPCYLSEYSYFSPNEQQSVSNCVSYCAQ